MPQIQELLPEFKKHSLDEFCREINHVQNSMIRTEADEVTYCLHIILRYEMEQAIFRDHVPVSELPALWNQENAGSLCRSHLPMMQKGVLRVYALVRWLIRLLPFLPAWKHLRRHVP